jgi:hypothetical protein
MCEHNNKILDGIWLTPECIVMDSHCDDCETVFKDKYYGEEAKKLREFAKKIGKLSFIGMFEY